MSLSGVFGELIGAVVGLYVANSVLSWHIPVINSAMYAQYLPYVNATIMLTCVIRMLMYLSPWYRLRMVFEGLAHVVSLYSLLMLLRFFPFDFSPINRVDINSVLRFALTIALFGVGIAIMTSIFRVIRGKTS